MSEGEKLTTFLGVVALAFDLDDSILVSIQSSIFQLSIVILLPALDLHILEVHGGEGLDESLSQAHVRHQRNVVIDGTTTDLVTIGQLT